MTRRALPLLLAFAALPGLLVGLGSIVVHEHEDGNHPHHHAAVVGHVDLEHDHDHDHEHEHEAEGAHSHDHAPDPEPPVEGEESPADGERHGHYRELRAQAMRRGSATAHLDLNLSGWATACWTPPAERNGCATESPRPPAEWRGHPPSRCARTTTRLVQGLGLLI